MTHAHGGDWERRATGRRVLRPFDAPSEHLPLAERKRRAEAMSRGIDTRIIRRKATKKRTTTTRPLTYYQTVAAQLRQRRS